MEFNKPSQADLEKNEKGSRHVNNRHLGSDTCWLYCPDGAISKGDGGYSIDLNYCKGCGICVQECPRGVISLVQEES